MVSSSPQPFIQGAHNQDSNPSENTADSNIGSQADLPSWTALEEPHTPSSEENTSGDDRPVLQLLQQSPRTPRGSTATARSTGRKNGASKASRQSTNIQRTLPSFFEQRGGSASAGPSTAASHRIRPAPNGSQVRLSPAAATISSGASGRARSASGRYVPVRSNPFKASQSNLVDVINDALSHNGPPQQGAQSPDASSRATTPNVGPFDADAHMDADSDIEEVPNPHAHTNEADVGAMNVSGLSPVRRTTNPNVPRPQRNEGNSIIDALSATFVHNDSSGAYGHMPPSASASAPLRPKSKPKPQSKRPRSRSNTPSEPPPKKAHVEGYRQQKLLGETEPARPTRPRRGDPAAPSDEVLAADRVERALDTRALGITFRPEAAPDALAGGALMRLLRRGAVDARGPSPSAAADASSTQMETEAEAETQIYKQTTPRWSEAGMFKYRLDALFGRGSMLRGFGKRPETQTLTPQKLADAAAAAPEDEEAASQASYSTVFVDIEGDEDPETVRIKATRQSSMARSQQLEPRQRHSTG